jgi:hypothetical protein
MAGGRLSFSSSSATECEFWSAVVRLDRRDTGFLEEPALLPTRCAMVLVEQADQVFFPSLETCAVRFAGITSVISEWASHTSPRTLYTKVLLPQLAAQGLWQWYKPADSLPLIPLITGADHPVVTYFGVSVGEK